MGNGVTISKYCTLLPGLNSEVLILDELQLYVSIASSTSHGLETVSVSIKLFIEK